MLRRGFRRLGGLHFLDQDFLRVGFRLQDGDLLGAVGLRHLAGFLDLLLGDGDGLVDDRALADDVGDLHAAVLDRLVALDALQLHFAIGGDLLQLLGALDALLLDGHRALAVLLGHFDLAQLFLLADLDQFVGLQACVLGDQSLLFAHARGLGFLAGLHGFDLTLLAGFRLGLLTLEREQRFTGADVLLGDLQLLVLLQFVGLDVLQRGQFGDLADAFGIQDVVVIEQVLGRLLEVVDGHVLQHVAIEVVADDLDDLVAEFLALLEQVGELELLADRLQRLGELGVEQFIHRVLVGGAVRADRLGHAQHVRLGLVDAQVERHGDVGAHVVLADQAFLAAAIHLQGDQADLHQFGAVEDRHDQRTGEVHLRLRAHVVDDQGGALVDLLVESLEQAHQAENEHQQDAEADEEGCDLSEGHGKLQWRA